MDDIVEATPRRRHTTAVALVGSGLVAGVVLAGLTAATAQTGQAPTPTPTVSAVPKADRPGGFGPRGHRGPGGRGDKGALGFGRGALHGEFTAPDPDGGYQTLAMQRGEVTAVSATSVTVKSDDGFSRTYAVNDDTLVNAGDQGIADVKTGDKVGVLAVVDGGTARAVRVMDGTQVGRLRDKWAPRRVKPSADASSTT
jgi:hypothetical protein